MILNINSKEMVKYARQFEQLHRSALPVAIRGALNKAAFDVKQNTMPASAGNEFVQRKANFFKANSKVDMAKGFAIGTMKSTVGFVPLKGNNKAVDELQEQEKGGTIEHRSLIPMDTARTGNSGKGMVRANARLAAIRGTKAINAQGVKVKSKKQKFIRAAFIAKKLHGKNAFVLGNKYGGNQTLSRIDKITFNKRKGTVNIKRTPLYTYRYKGKIRVARTNFMKRASLESGIKVEKFFVDEALKQFKKFTRK